MQIIESPQEMRNIVKSWRCAGEEIGYIPTMGALHAGHMALVEAARAANQRVVASIFVNPLQFGPHEDLDKYPRPIERDSQLLKEAGCDILFAPKVDAIYDGEEFTHGIHTYVEVNKLGDMWEGAVRPGHLRGVATVLVRFFNIVPAQRAYFGEKDYQQLKVVERVVQDLRYDLEIVPVATVREEDGLALSSRNVYLSEAERQVAPTLHQALQVGVTLVRNGEREVSTIGAAIQAVCDASQLIKVQYVAIVNAETLAPLDTLDGQPARALIAARLGSTRLIDNIAI